MSLKSTKEHLVQLLADQDNRVIALSGKWGTGKSHLWQDIKAASKDTKVNESLYVSLFGLAGLGEIKMKLIQNALRAADANPVLLKTAQQAAKSVIKGLEGFHKGFSVLSDVGLVLAPTLLKGRLIVLDDIERKNEGLSIHQVLGFIDEYTQQHKSRFVIILNTDQLRNRDDWDILREKVLDQELRLSTTPREAFEIAVHLFPSRYADVIQPAVERCAVTNIRIIGKIIKAVNRILGDRQQLSEALLSRVIPSTVLLAAINYKGIENGPNFEFVLGRGKEDWTELAQDEQQEKTEEEKRKGEWRLLLNDLGIIASDEYELLVVEFLQSGLFDVADVSAIIARYANETEAMEAQQAARGFIEQQLWNHLLSEDDLLRCAQKLIAKGRYLSPQTVTSLHEAVSELAGGALVGDAIVTDWIAGLRAKDLKHIERPEPFHGPIYAWIEEEFNAIESKAQSKTTALDACLDIVNKSGWGPRQEMVLKLASVEEFESIIRTADIHDLQTFMRKMLELTIRKGNYQPHFGSAMDHFVEACRNIAHDPEAVRLGRLIKLLFHSSKLPALLEEPGSQPAAADDVQPEAPA